MISEGATPQLLTRRQRRAVKRRRRNRRHLAALSGAMVVALATFAAFQIRGDDAGSAANP